MAPIKFEEQIKDKLEQRTIQPSSDAWGQLSKKLNTEEKKKSKHLFFYAGIAASIVGILLISNVMFNTSENQSIVPAIVDIQEKEVKELKSKTETEYLPKTEMATTVSKDNTQVDNKKEEQPQALSIKNEQKVAAVIEAPVATEKESKHGLQPEKQLLQITDDAVAFAAVEDEGNSKETIKPANKLTFEDARVLQVVTDIEKLEIEKGSISDTEIENLLKKAEKEILQHRIFNETTRTVDADALLQDVESDLDQSFRSRVFEGLKTGSETLLSAVAKRNN